MNSELLNALRNCERVELNHLYESSMPVWPTHPKFVLVDSETYAGGDGNYNNLLQMGDHCGTHVDSPSHFIPEGKTIEQIDVGQLIGRGVKIDVSDYPDDTEITVAMIQAWEKRNGDIKPNDIVLFRTGHDEKWRPRPHHKPFLSGWSGLSGEGAEYLLGKGVNVIGSDAMSLDAWSNSSYPSHQIILGAGKLIMENLANLDKVPEIFIFIALPLRVKGGSASPVRAIALI
ncbi:cyclase family protein [Acerihabitans sp. KWT182]|uniref:Cyclase family protein n=1 Tax=Acerihabitans sp. KWT182 TaxID=3157919 RepID=A0AAU7Q6A1_9GAMM